MPRQPTRIHALTLIIVDIKADRLTSIYVHNIISWQLLCSSTLLRNKLAGVGFISKRHNAIQFLPSFSRPGIGPGHCTAITIIPKFA